MELLHLIFDQNKFKNTCCICLSFNENNVNIYDDMEIVDTTFRLNISLLNLITNTLPQHEIFLHQMCTSCLDVIMKLFIILHKSNIKKDILTLMLNKIDNVIDKQIGMHEMLKIDLNKLIDRNMQSSVLVTCNKCKMEFETDTDLNYHIRLAHTQRFDATVCSFCGKIWPTSKQLKMHLNCHKYKRCPYCAKVLKTHAHYNKHVRNHSNDNKFENIHVEHKNNIVPIEKLAVDSNETDAAFETIDESSIDKASNIEDKRKTGDETNTSVIERENISESLNNTSNTFNKAVHITFEKLNNSNIPHIYVYKRSDKQKYNTDNNIDDNVIETPMEISKLHKNALPTLKQLAYESYCDHVKKTLLSGNREKDIMIQDVDIKINKNNSDLIKALDTVDTKHLTGNDLASYNKALVDKRDNFNSHKLGIQIEDSRVIQFDFAKDDFVTKTKDISEDNSNIKNKSKRKFKKFYLCEHCPYKSLTKSNLEAHYNKIHLNIRPYVCNVCFKKFYRKSNLYEHLLTHDKRKNLTCEYCGSNFVSKKTLENHLKIHNGVKSFYCDICNKYFLHKSHLGEHIKRTHEKKILNCFLCEKIYGLRKDLNRHVARVHNIKNNTSIML